MKKIKLAAMLCVCMLAASAQPYGHRKYPNSAVLNSAYRAGIVNTINPGFLMAGMKNGTKIIHIDRTDLTGLFTVAGNFKKDYQLAFSSTVCGQTIGGISNCVGVSIAETPTVNASALENFVMTGAWPNGCFFSVHAADGAPVPNSVYSLTFTTGNATVEKPLICRSTQTLGNYYICGKYNSDMYVIKIDLTGTVLWSGYYSAGSNITPYAIIESPYATNTGIELVVVGRYDDPSAAADGFFLGLDNTGTSVVFNTYGDPSGSSDPNNFFRCVTVARSTTGGSDGFVIGGVTDPINNTGKTWVLKVDESGGVLWNTILTSGNDKFSEDAYAVLERSSAVNGFEYYVLAQASSSANNGMIVFKLDNTGSPSSAGNNDFLYTSTPPSVYQPVALSFLNGGSSGLGFHAYAANSGGAYIAESYFNGVTGCNQNLTTVANTEAGPTNSTTPSLGNTGSFTGCADMSLSFSGPVYNVTTVCSANSIGGGNNARTSGATGIAGQQDDLELNAYPNPTNGKLTFDALGDATLSVFSVAGNEVVHAPVHAGSNTIDLSAQSDGMYFIKISGADKTQTIRVIKN